MSNPRTVSVPAAAAGTFALGGDLPVNRMGFGAMRLTGKGIWDHPGTAPKPSACSSGPSSWE